MRTRKALIQTLSQWYESGHKPVSYGIEGSDSDEAWAAYLTWAVVDHPTLGRRLSDTLTRVMQDPQGLVFVDENDAAARGEELFLLANTIYEDRVELDRNATID